MPRAKADTVSRRAICVLGMHRSGTSAVSGAMRALGVSEPRTPVQPNLYNKKGYFESEPLMRFHETMLNRLGQGWTSLLPLDDDTIEALFLENRRKLQDILSNEFPGSGPYLLKDPRLSRIGKPVLDCVTETDGTAPLAIIMVRDPREVAASLFRRNQMHAVRGQLLWLRYMLDAEFVTRDIPRLFLSYESLLTDGAAQLDHIEEAIGPGSWTDAQRIAALEFLSADLRHHSAIDEGAVLLPQAADALSLFEALSDGQRQDAVVFDAMRNEFDRGATGFGVMLDITERHSRHLTRQLSEQPSRSMQSQSSNVPGRVSLRDFQDRSRGARPVDDVQSALSRILSDTMNIDEQLHALLIQMMESRSESRALAETVDELLDLLAARSLPSMPSSSTR